MRTNIEIDDDLMAEAMQCTGNTTKRATVDEALRTIIRLNAQRDILKLEGKVQWIGDLQEMRKTKKRDFGALGWPDE